LADKALKAYPESPVLTERRGRIALFRGLRAYQVQRGKQAQSALKVLRVSLVSQGQKVKTEKTAPFPARQE
jgi:hypothetical protein